MTDRLPSSEAVRSMLLTPAEMRDLTQRQHADAQIAALEREGWPYILDGDGRPRVDRSVYEARACAGEPPRPVVCARKKPRLELVR